jgi:hypothetical protein
MRPEMNLPKVAHVRTFNALIHNGLHRLLTGAMQLG